MKIEVKIEKIEVEKIDIKIDRVNETKRIEQIEEKTKQKIEKAIKETTEKAIEHKIEHKIKDKHTTEDEDKENTTEKTTEKTKRRRGRPPKREKEQEKEQEKETEEASVLATKLPRLLASYKDSINYRQYSLLKNNIIKLSQLHYDKIILFLEYLAYKKSMRSGIRSEKTFDAQLQIFIEEPFTVLNNAVKQAISRGAKNIYIDHTRLSAQEYAAAKELDTAIHKIDKGATNIVESLHKARGQNPRLAQAVGTLLKYALINSEKVKIEDIDMIHKFADKQNFIKEYAFLHALYRFASYYNALEANMNPLEAERIFAQSMGYKVNLNIVNSSQSDPNNPSPPLAQLKGVAGIMAKSDGSEFTLFASQSGDTESKINKIEDAGNADEIGGIEEI